jgi:hypothetical protein
MKIKIVIPHYEDDLPDPLKDLGVKVGEIVDASPVSDTRHGAMRFRVIHEDAIKYCTVMSKNYKKV